MEVIDQRQIKAKAFSVRATMNNKQLSRIIDDALNSPLGSIKRKKARNLLMSLQKSASNYSAINDGQGGIWDTITSGVKNIFSGSQPTAQQSPAQMSVAPQMSTVDPATATKLQQSAQTKITSQPELMSKAPIQSIAAKPVVSSYPGAPLASTADRAGISTLADRILQPVKLVTKGASDIMPTKKQEPATPELAAITGKDWNAELIHNQLKDRKISSLKAFELTKELENQKSAIEKTRQEIERKNKAREYISKGVMLGDIGSGYEEWLHQYLTPEEKNNLKNRENEIVSSSPLSKMISSIKYKPTASIFIDAILNADTPEKIIQLEKIRDDAKNYSKFDKNIPEFYYRSRIGSKEEKDSFAGMPDWLIKKFPEVELLEIQDKVIEIKQNNPEMSDDEIYKQLKFSYFPELAETKTDGAGNEVTVGDELENRKKDAESLLNQYTDVEDSFMQYYLDLVSNHGVIPSDESIQAEHDRWLSLDKPSGVSDSSSGAASNIDNISSGEIISMINSGDYSDVENIFNNLDPSATDYTSTAVQKAKAYVDSGVGSEMFANIVMGDKKMLAELLGLPEEAVAGLPDSGLLSDQLNSLYDSINKSYNLDEQLDKITEMKNAGYDIENNMKNYIRGKDEYLGTIDKLIEQTGDLISSMDTSNPHVAKRMSNYLNYLTILQGRQNKRYTDFLNDSISQYEADINSSIDLYNATAQKAKEDYDRLSSVTTETYTNIKNGLVNLYESLASANANLYDTQKDYYDMMKAQTDYAIKLLDLEEKQLKIENGGGIDWDKAETEKILSFLGINRDKDSGALSFTTYSPYQAVDWAGTANQKPEYALNKFHELSVNDVNNALSGGSFYDKLNEHINGYVNGAKVSGVNTTTADQVNATFVNLLYNNAFQTIKNYLLEESATLRDAIKNLTGVDRKGFDKPQYYTGDYNADKKKFLNDYEASLGDYGTVLFNNFYDVVTKHGLQPKDFAYYDSNTKLVNLDDNTLVNIVSGDIRNKIVYEIMEKMNLQNKMYLLQDVKI